MARILILDDDDIRHKQFAKKYKNEELVHVYIAAEAINYLEYGPKFDYIFLDHDLGGQQMVESGVDTGYEVAEWLSRNDEYKPRNSVILHSLNPVGRKNMCNVLKQANIHVIESPFLWKN